MDRILIVEDSQFNIDILRSALQDEYELSVGLNGKVALDVIKRFIPDLILLDVMMPVMDGYEFMQEIKRIDAYKEIPVIFLTAQMESEEKKRAFELGAVDYITKPFDVLEVKSRVETHLSLSRTKREIQELLTKTFVGATKMLTDILAMANPSIYGLTTRIRNLAQKLAVSMKVEEVWKIEIASMLAFVGTFNIPENVFNEYTKGKVVSFEYKRMFENHPKVGANLVRQIPRLDDVASIIEIQRDELGLKPFDPFNIIQSGAQILKVATHYEVNIMLGKSSEMILRGMKDHRIWFNQDLVSSLESSLKNMSIDNIDYVSITRLENNMVVKENIYNKEQKLIIPKDTIVNELVKEHLKLLYEFGVIDDRIKVQK